MLYSSGGKKKYMDNLRNQHSKLSARLKSAIKFNKKKAERKKEVTRSRISRLDSYRTFSDVDDHITNEVNIE